MPEVKLVNITKRYGKIAANDQVNFTIKEDEYISVIGPSGCGKTTLIKIIAGITKPDEGEIYIDGKLVNNVPIEDRGIGYVFQNIALFPHLSVWDNIVYGPRVKGTPVEEIRPLALEMLEMIKLDTRSDARPYELSGGTQQKTAVARALTSRAELLLLDEPLGALDVKVRTMLRDELRKLVKDLKLTAFHVTHDQEEAMSISDRVIVMKRGRVVEAGSPLELYTRPRHIFTANFVGEANFLVGNIVESWEEGSLVSTENGIPLVTYVGDRKLGERVVAAFRPEYVSTEGSEGFNKLSGVIMEVLYSGRIVRVKIRLSGGVQIMAKTALHSDVYPFTIGKAVTFSVSSQDVLLYSYPEEGLEKELALE